MKNLSFLIRTILALILFCATVSANAGVVNIDYKYIDDYKNINISYSSSTISSAKIIVKNVPDNSVGSIIVKALGDDYVIEPNVKTKSDSLWLIEYNLEGELDNDNRQYVFRFESDKNNFNIKYINESMPAPSVKLAQNDIYDYAINKIKTEYQFDRYYSTEKGLYIRNNMVHIFLDQDGDYILTSIPPKVEETYTYMVVLFYDKNAGYKFSYSVDGEYDPQFNILNTTENLNGTYANSSNGSNTPIEVGIKETTFGPYTGEFIIKLKRVELNTGNSDIIMHKKIKVAKKYHVSLAAGLYSTGLSNPTNITPFVKSNGDTTLVAENPTSRRVVTLMAVYYPVPRTFLYEPNYLSLERIGILLGTQIESDQFENLFVGLQYDLARGLSLAGGLHYGRHQIIADQEDFNFGEDVFSGNLEESLINRWDFSYFMGVNLDLRILQYFVVGE